MNMQSFHIRNDNIIDTVISQFRAREVSRVKRVESENHEGSGRLHCPLCYFIQSTTLMECECAQPLVEMHNMLGAEPASISMKLHSHQTHLFGGENECLNC